MTEKFQEQLAENRFIGMCFILLVAAAGLYTEYVPADIWSSTSLLALAIFSGAKTLDGRNVSIGASKE